MFLLFINSIFVLCAIALIYAVAKLIQLNLFRKFLYWEIEELFSGDRWETEDICIDSSYEELKRSMPWNYKFETIIVRRYRNI